MSFYWRKAPAPKLLGVIIGAVLMAGVWDSGMEFTVLGVHLTGQGVLRDVIFLAAAGLSLALTPADVRSANQFTWEPVLEVGKLFFGIFVTIVPVLEMLKVGMAGAFAPVVAMVTNADGTANNAMYFWMTGALSGFLDNAPTYLAFFNMAGGDASVLMTEGALTLMAISMGSVFMGANADGYFHGLGIYGRQQLYRQCAEFYGGCHCAEPRAENAELLRLPAVVGGHFNPYLFAADMAVSRVRYTKGIYAKAYQYKI